MQSGAPENEIHDLVQEEQQRHKADVHGRNGSASRRWGNGGCFTVALCIISERQRQSWLR